MHVCVCVWYSNLTSKCNVVFNIYIRCVFICIFSRCCLSLAHAHRVSPSTHFVFRLLHLVLLLPSLCHLRICDFSLGSVSISVRLFFFARSAFFSSQFSRVCEISCILSVCARLTAWVWVCECVGGPCL